MMINVKVGDASMVWCKSLTETYETIAGALKEGEQSNVQLFGTNPPTLIYEFGKVDATMFEALCEDADILVMYVRMVNGRDLRRYFE